MNLLCETLECLTENKKSPADVRWVGALQFSEDDRNWVNLKEWNNWSGWCEWEEFARIAKDLDYNEGLGRQHIHPGLCVVGDDWWLERHEYDGSEWWEFKQLPIRPYKHSAPEDSDIVTADPLVEK